ncbi:MAG: hypothetical protein WC558_04120 [Patulibacter sp.]
MSDATATSPSLRAGLRGVAPLDGRIEPWMAALGDDHATITQAFERFGSPVNLLEPTALGRNAGELTNAAREAGVDDVRVFFARKANKALAFVDEARGLDLGVDVAGERELRQTLDRGVAPERIVVTAAVKPRPLLELCVTSGVTIVIDNADELALLADVAAAAGSGPAVPIAVRLASDLGPDRLPTRFGLTEPEALELVDRYARAAGDEPATNASGEASSAMGGGGGARSGAGEPVRTTRPLHITGVHFHLDGYAAADRMTALRQALAFVDALVDRGHAPTFVDIGGGIPMRYLDDADQWDAFWAAHCDGLLDGDPLTYDGHGLGLTVHDGAIIGRPNVYPAAQPLIRGAWLRQVLEAPAATEAAAKQATAGAPGAGATAEEATGEASPGSAPTREPQRLVPTIAEALNARGLQLRCEPGRSLLDGCGVTAAQVVQRKQRRDGTWLIGLAMNRTQCRSTADDLLVDPLLLPTGSSQAGSGDETGPIEGYLVGAYCIERELLTWRRMTFPQGVRVGDTVVFPNTAGYHMHILESASHQIPLARNVVVDATDHALTLDAIDV